MPGNALDLLVAHFGVSQLAEMTGRKMRFVTASDGTTRREPRAENGVSADQVNIEEKKAFLSGRKPVAVISDAASSGISLHADPRFGWFEMASTLPDDTAPSVSLDHLQAQAAPTHPKAPPEHLGSCPGLGTPPQAAPKSRVLRFQPAGAAVRRRLHQDEGGHGPDEGGLLLVPARDVRPLRRERHPHVRLD